MFLLNDSVVIKTAGEACAAGRKICFEKRNMTNETQSAESDDAKRKLATETAPDVPEEAPPPIALAVDHYLSSVRGIARTARIAIPHIIRWKIEEMTRHTGFIEEFLKQYKINQEPPEDPGKNNAQSVSTLAVTSARDLAKFINAARETRELDAFNSTAILTKSLFTQIFSEFDAFMGSLLKILYLKNEELLKSIAREISFEDLLGFDNLQAAKLSMLDKEIETFRRDSYVEQFSTLEKKFKIPLKKFPEWADFVELSQRRNILTHNGGGVSDQYISVCEREGYKFKEKPKKGRVFGG
jgi:hypothetical protein